jgi:hypothetical protein
MPIVDPDSAGIGIYLVSAVLLALGIAIFLYILIGDARANRREAAAEAGVAPVLSSAAAQGRVAGHVSAPPVWRNPGPHRPDRRQT